VATAVSDARVKYDENFDLEHATPKERAAYLVAQRQRRARAKKREEDEAKLM
jgi:hypothetical protein